VVSRFKTGAEVRRIENARPATATRAGVHPAAAKKTITTRKAVTAGAVTKGSVKGAALPELGTTKHPVATPKGGDDGQWESF
jgi:hypothetical protein